MKKTGRSYEKSVVLNKSHDVSAFDCGEPSLNLYIQKHALTNIGLKISQTYVALDGSRVVGYYTMGFNSIKKVYAPSKMVRGLPPYKMPCVLIARLAVDKTEQKKGMGERLLINALIKALKGTVEIPARAVVVKAKHERAKTFYEKYGFASSPLDPLYLFLLMKDIEKLLV